MPSQPRQLLKKHCCTCTFCSTCLKTEADRLETQVPDAEFFAVEQALLAAGRHLATKPSQVLHPAASSRKLPASITSSRNPSAALQTDLTVDCKKRKLPPSFAQQQQNDRAQTQTGLQYKVCTGGITSPSPCCFVQQAAGDLLPFHAGTYHLCIHCHRS